MCAAGTPSKQRNYCRNPSCKLQWEDALASFKTRLASGEDVFGPLIRKYLLDNKHRYICIFSTLYFNR